MHTSSYKISFANFLPKLGIALLIGSFIPKFAVSENLNFRASSPESVRIEKFKQAARAKLISKLTNPDGKAAKIFVLDPINYTALKDTSGVNQAIYRGVTAYDPRISVHQSKIPLAAVTLEEFRLTMAKLKADIVIATVMNQKNFDLYLYDKRSPYQIYAHNEPIAGAAQYELTKEAAGYYTKLLVRRTLYRYIKNQYYELPRDESPAVLKSQIPRFIASTESLEMVNRESRSTLYTSVGIGAALSRGGNSQLWNSNIFALQLGLRLKEKLFLEANFEMFSYNALVGSLKYLFSNRDRTFKTAVGLGLGYILSERQTLNWDQTNGGHAQSYYAVPSFTVLLPISDVYLKAESQLFISLNPPQKYIFTLMPGIHVQF